MNQPRFDVVVQDSSSGMRLEVTVSAKDKVDALAKTLRRRVFAEALLADEPLSHNFNFWVYERA